MGISGSKTPPLTHPFKGKPFEGVIDFATRLCGGSPFDKGYIDITGSSTSPRSLYKVEDVITSKKDGEWVSENSPDQYIKFDFKERRIELRHYALETYMGKSGGMHLKSWRVEGSEDGFNWVVLDEVKNNRMLNAPHAVLVRSCMPHGFHRFLLISMTDKNHFGSNCFTLKRIEFFGNLKL